MQRILMSGHDSLEPRVNRLALKGKHAEYAFVHPSKRLATHKAFERLDAERELAEGKRALDRQPALPQTLEILGPACIRGRR